MNSYIMKDNPCSPDCPNRKPGCDCELRKGFQKKKEERKQKIRKAKDRESMIESVRSKRRT